MSARSVGTAAAHWIGLVGLGRRLMRHCDAVVRLFLAGAVLAVATFIACRGSPALTPPANSERPTLSGYPTSGRRSTRRRDGGRACRRRPTAIAGSTRRPTAAGRTSPVPSVRPTRSSSAHLGTVIRVNVTATNSDGSAEQISEATAQIKNLPVTPPGPPNGLTAAVAPAPGVGSRQVELSWSPVASNGGLQIRRLRDPTLPRRKDLGHGRRRGVHPASRRGVPARQRNPVLVPCRRRQRRRPRTLERRGPCHTEMDPGRSRPARGRRRPRSPCGPATGQAHMEAAGVQQWSTDHRLRDPTLPGGQNLEDRQ